MFRKQVSGITITVKNSEYSSCFKLIKQYCNDVSAYRLFACQLQSRGFLSFASKTIACFSATLYAVYYPLLETPLEDGDAWTFSFADKSSESSLSGLNIKIALDSCFVDCADDGNCGGVGFPSWFSADAVTDGCNDYDSSDDGFSVAKFFRGCPTGRFLAGGDNDSVNQWLGSV